MNEDKEKQLTELILKDDIRRTVAHYGIEGAEDAIKRVYSLPQLQTLRNKLLKILYSLDWNLT